MKNDVLVIGAGVSGLTTGLFLAEAGLRVRVLAQDPPLATTSAVAGASWGPYMIEDPRVLEWSAESFAKLEALATDDDTSGVRMVDGMEAATHEMAPPSWAREVPSFRLCSTDELPSGYASGWRYTIPLVDMQRYLIYLQERLAACGTHVQIGTVGSFAQVADQASVLVNCSGLGARVLAADTDLFPIRGQLVVVDNPGIESFFQDNSVHGALTYVLPHGDHVVLGGSAIPGSENDKDDLDEAKAIIERCTAVEPLLDSARVVGHRVGLRPTRSSVRLDTTQAGGRPVIHNYGHGGSGLTLSWGCAREVLSRIEAL